MEDLLALDKAELGQGHDAVALERGLEGEIEAVQGFDVGQPGHQEGGLDASGLADRELLREQELDRFQGGDLTLLDLTAGAVDHLQGARHLEGDQGGLEAVEEGGWPCRVQGRGHDGSPA